MQACASACPRIVKPAVKIELQFRLGIQSRIKSIEDVQCNLFSDLNALKTVSTQEFAIKARSDLLCRDIERYTEVHQQHIELYTDYTPAYSPENLKHL